MSAVLFIADPHLAGLLQGLAGQSDEFKIESIADLGRTDYAVARTLNTYNPDVALLEMTNLERDLPLAAAIRKNAPALPVVALAGQNVRYQLGRSDADLTSVAVWPFSAIDLERAISDAVHKMRGEVYENLIAFLPGKAGSGASTTALQTAGALAHELKRRVLVLDADLHSGLLAGMLNIDPKASIRDALADAPAMDNTTWQRHVTSVEGIDFLLANPMMKEPVPHWTHYFQLLRFAAPKYDFMLVDLPEVVNSATAELVRRSRAVYVVSTPEFASLKLSKQRCLELANWGVEPARIFGILNREHKDDLGAKDAEKILGFPVLKGFPNDYRAVQRAVKQASFVDPRSNLGEAYLEFSKMLMGVEAQKKSFMGMFRR